MFAFQYGREYLTFDTLVIVSRSKDSKIKLERNNKKD